MGASSRPRTRTRPGGCRREVGGGLPSLHAVLLLARTCPAPPQTQRTLCSRGSTRPCWRLAHQSPLAASPPLRRHGDHCAAGRRGREHLPRHGGAPPPPRSAPACCRLLRGRAAVAAAAAAVAGSAAAQLRQERPHGQHVLHPGWRAQHACKLPPVLNPVPRRRGTRTCRRTSAGSTRSIPASSAGEEAARCDVHPCAEGASAGGALPAETCSGASRHARLPPTSNPGLPCRRSGKLGVDFSLFDATQPRPPSALGSAEISRSGSPTPAAAAAAALPINGGMQAGPHGRLGERLSPFEARHLGMLPPV